MIRRSRNFKLAALNALPSLLVFLLVIFCLMPKHAGIGHFMPVLWLIPVFFWGTFETREIPLWVGFASGLMMDAVSSPVLGLSALLTLAFMLTLHAQRKYIHKEGFLIRWGYFAIFFAAYLIIQWLVLSLWMKQVLPISSAFFQWVLTLCVYPLLHRAFELLSEYISQRRWQITHGM